MLVTAPLPSAYVQDTQNYQAYVDAMRSFAAANGTQYWDFSLFKDTDLLPIGFDDFSDMHHLNGQGAETFSKAFATVAARSAAGEDVSGLFYDTVAEKLVISPDSTVQQGEGNCCFLLHPLAFCRLWRCLSACGTACPSLPAGSWFWQPTQCSAFPLISARFLR